MRLCHGVDGAHGREVGVDAEHTDDLVTLTDKVRRRLQRLATGTAALVARNKRQVAILGIVSGRKVGGPVRNERLFFYPNERRIKK